MNNGGGPLTPNRRYAPFFSLFWQHFIFLNQVYLAHDGYEYDDHDVGGAPSVFLQLRFLCEVQVLRAPFNPSTAGTSFWGQNYLELV